MHKLMAIAVTIAMTSVYLGGGASANDKKPVDHAAVAAAYEQGRAFAAHQEFGKAMSAYEKADKLSQHQCTMCLLGMFAIYKRVGDSGNALDVAKKAVKEAGDNKSLAAIAHLSRGMLLGQMTSKPKDKKLTEAVSEIREALALDPSNAIAHFDLGFMLIKQEDDTAGIAELKIYLASNNPSPKDAKLAQAMIADPRRAREPFAPDFSFTALDGTRVSLDSLHGKVALLDFWATWCPPCRESVPTLLALHKKFADQPVEFIGISADANEQAWQKFVADHHMDWPDYLDSNGAVQENFSVDSYPTYIVIDRAGLIRFRQSGFSDLGSFQEIEGAIKKALKEKPETDTVTAKGSPTGQPKQ
jgi:cytochrome c biogenesis protein CcmG/thiol:disulfide interchange protein DsbE